MLCGIRAPRIFCNPAATCGRRRSCWDTATLRPPKSTPVWISKTSPPPTTAPTPAPTSPKNNSRRRAKKIPAFAGMERGKEVLSLRDLLRSEIHDRQLFANFSWIPACAEITKRRGNKFSRTKFRLAINYEARRSLFSISAETAILSAVRFFIARVNSDVCVLYFSFCLCFSGLAAEREGAGGMV